jgi:hypothetical protein
MHNENPSVNSDPAAPEAEFQAACEMLEQLRQTPRELRNAADLEAYEREVAAVTDRITASLVAMKIQAALDSPEMRAESAALAQSLGKKPRNEGRREVAIRFARGGAVRLHVSYWSGTPRKNKPASGCYPGLILLGIYERCTPLLTSDLAQLAAAASSFDEAVRWLADHGVDIDIKTLQVVVYAFAAQARTQQKLRSHFPDKVTGRRIAVSVDGGRIRIRGRKKGPKTAKGRHRYSTSWREPKLLIIYVINAEGEIDRSIPVWLDGTMKGPDAIFGLLRHYLSGLGVSVGKLAAELKLRTDQIVEIVDFYHAVEHLGKVAALQGKWTGRQRKSWIRKQRKRLLAGKVEEVIGEIARLSAGRKSKLLLRELEYFRKHRKRMNYAQAKEEGLPIGSGAIESAVRRVVNLRLKGPGIFWERESAEAMLLLRSYYKSGRWNQLKELAFMVPEKQTA